MNPAKEPAVHGARPTAIVRTHEVCNQLPPLVDYDLLASDAAFTALAREEGADSFDCVRAIGHLAGTAEAVAWGFEANAHPPRLPTHDRFGHRVDEVEFHPAWQRIADAFCTSRLAGDGGHTFGALPPGADLARSSSGTGHV